MTRILLTCLLIATFESPIGQSIDGYVIRHTVSWWCPDYDAGPRLMIEERVVDNKTGKTIGRANEHLYSVPTKDAPSVEVVPVDPASAPWGIP